MYAGAPKRVTAGRASWALLRHEVRQACAHETLPAFRRRKGCIGPSSSTTAAAWASSHTSKASAATRSSRTRTTCLCRMDHRGARGAEPNTGDGAGMLTALPHEFLAKVAKQAFGVTLPPPGKFAAGIVFLPTDAAERERCKAIVAAICAEEGQALIGWRLVPTNADGADLGRRRACCGAAHRAAVRRSRRRLRGRRFRAQAVPAAQAGEPPAARRHDAEAGQAVLRLQPLEQDADLQGHADAGSAAEFLSRPARRRLHDASRDGAFAILDEHVPELGPRAAEPLHVAQRRDQHAARQRELDARATRRRRERFVRRRLEEAVPDRGARLLGLRRVRQRARVPADDAAVRCRNP